MRHRLWLTTFIIGLACLMCGQTEAGRKKRLGRFVPGALRGGPAAQARQNTEAELHKFRRITDRDMLKELIGKGILVRVKNTAAYRLSQIAEADLDNEDDYRYVLPHVRDFLDHELALAQQETGRKRPFVVTSLVRTEAYQRALCEKQKKDREREKRRKRRPTISATCGTESWETSAHVYGIAFDIRIRGMEAQVPWFKRRWGKLERAGMIVAIREKKAFHVMVSPSYVGYLAGKIRKTKRPSRGRACSLPS